MLSRDEPDRTERHPRLVKPFIAVYIVTAVIAILILALALLE